MKLVRDLSVTAAHGSVTPVAWDAPWASPLSATDPNLVLDFAAGVYGAGGIPSSLTSTLTLTRASTATHVDASGALATAGIDTARIDHDPNSLAPAGLLLENDRENLIVQSGTPAAQTIALGAVAHTLSFYGNGVVTLTGAHADSVAGVGSYPDRTEYTFTPTAGDLTITFSGNITAPQLEVGAVASSYIPTAATSVVRADDISSLTLGSWFTGNSGTLVFGGVITDAAANDRIIEMDAGDTATRLSILWNTTLGKPQFQVWNGGALQAAIAPGGNSVGLGNHFRVAIAYSDNDFVISLNGSPVVTDTLGSVPSGLTTLRIGRSVWGAQGLVLAESLVHYPSRLADSEVQALSA